MKLLTILLLFSFHVNATDYHVKNGGSDVANGLTDGTAWATIAKVNASSFSPGDRILFKKGDSWNERLTPPSSGSAGNVITFGSYGVGNDPVITGFQTVVFNDLGSNIWSATFASSVLYQNTVYINGRLRAKGRYPNTGYLTFTSHSGQSQITGGLTGTPNYTGGEVVIRVNAFTTDHLYITSQSSGTINFSPSTYYALTDGFGYFIQNIPSVLDTLNEWAYDTTSKVITTYATSIPTIKASSIDTLVNTNGKDYLTFDGIDFTGGNLTAFQINGSDNITITNCDFSDMGANAITGQTSNFITVSNCTINDCLNDGIIMLDFLTSLADSDDGVITNNVFHNIGTMPGMGKSRFQTYSCIELFSDRGQITFNTMDSIGYLPIFHYGMDFVVRNNYINQFGYVKSDGGGIYTGDGGGTQPTGWVVASNIVRNGQSSNAGVVGTSISHGIYMDDNAQFGRIDSNTVQSCTGYGIFIHNATDMTMRYNTLVDNNLQYYTLQVPAFSGNFIFSNNTLYTSNANYLTDYYRFDLNPYTALDSNHYSRPTNELQIIRGNNGNLYSLAQWKAATAFDQNATGTPSGITATAPLLKYNTTNAIVNLPLTGSYIDMRGGVYTNLVSVGPYQSKLLYKLTSDVQPTLNVKIRRVN